MARSTAPRRVLAAVVAALALLAAACGDDDGAEDVGTDTTEVEPSETEQVGSLDDEAITDTTDIDATTSSAPDDEGPAVDVDADQVIEITVTAGEVEGGGRQRVALGETVALVITSDALDEVHVHGYDLYVDLVPGQPAVVDFPADIPGVFEVELHDARLPLVELEVS